MSKLPYEFFHRPCLEVAHDLVGKVLVHNGHRLRISETEAYCGEADTACHAHKGRTKRTEVMYMDAGTVYVYLCYGIHWLLNIVTGDVDDPQAVLIRACVDAEGPGKLTKQLGINGQLNRQSVLRSDLWIEDDGFVCDVVTDKRVGIAYASQEDQGRPWRFKMKRKKETNMKDPNCGYCMGGDILAGFGIKICDLQVSQLILFKEQSHPGRVIVAYKDHVSELVNISDEERNLFFADVAQAANAIHKAFHPDKVNYGAYGDGGCHLHFHLVPKYQGEFEWGTPFAMNPGKTYLTEEEYAEMIEKIKAAL